MLQGTSQLLICKQLSQEAGLLVYLLYTLPLLMGHKIILFIPQPLPGGSARIIPGTFSKVK